LASAKKARGFGGAAGECYCKIAEAFQSVFPRTVHAL